MHSILFAVISSLIPFLIFRNIYYLIFALSACLSHITIGDRVLKIK
jgi:hypothetical protein